MTAWQEHRGILLFSLIAVAVLAGALAAFAITGPMGIEDRFNAAAGIIAGEEDAAGAGIFGFFLEGNLLPYLIVLAVLAGGSILVYRKYRI